MSRTSPATSSGSSSSFHTILCDALERYREKTKKNLVVHPLTADLKNCELPSDILTVLDKKYHVQDFIQCQSGDKTSEQWLNATFTVIASFSAALGEGVGLVFPPAKVIFAGIGVLLIAAKDVRADKDALVGIFGRIESFFRRLEIYTEVPPTDVMKELIVWIMVEVLEILAVATKEIKQRFAKKYMKKLIGRTDIEDALKKLDKLTQEEALMASAEAVKLGRSIDNKTDKLVDAMQQIEVDLSGLTRGQLQEKFQKWLSPPDPSINFNTARKAYHDGTGTWFTQGVIFKRWKVSGSENLLWVHGKPGSGKSILSSAIIQDVSDAEASYLIYFFFDFKDTAKQDNRALLSSFLIQLSAQSNLCFKTLFDIYSKHDRGSRQPSEGTLLECLKHMLRALRQAPIYLIVDAIDECPNTSKAPGSPRSRQEVLEVVKELVELRLPTLHICVTSRPEFDIRNYLEKLASFKLCLHDQDGQKQDIAEYVRSVVYSGKDPVMMKWGEDIKHLVIQTLSHKADGMFRWIVCQLDTLRECLARNVERVLNELPKSLDETYQRVLREISMSNRDDVYRLLQCLVVSKRPLRVEELAEVLAVDFDTDKGIPKLKPDWRWEDQEQALQAACSSLISIVDVGQERVVQFSHFSVKEFLVSPRFADSSGDVSRYHISLYPAHTILAQACMSVLLRLGDCVARDINVKRFPLVEYAAAHWVKHAQFEDVSSRIWEGMKDLFNPDKPYFAAWLRLHDIDTNPTNDSAFFHFTPLRGSDGSPLYYASLCGFYDLVKYLLLYRPQQIFAHGGYYVTPLVAALAGNYFHIAELLLQYGGDVDVRGNEEKTPLYSTSAMGYSHTVQWLLNHGADANARMTFPSWTPLLAAARGGHLEVAQILVEHNADVKSRDDIGWTPLHVTSENGHLEVARLLVKSGADVGARDDKGRTALQLAEDGGHEEIAKFLSEHHPLSFPSFLDLFLRI